MIPLRSRFAIGSSQFCCQHGGGDWLLGTPLLNWWSAAGAPPVLGDTSHSCRPVCMTWTWRGLPLWVKNWAGIPCSEGLQFRGLVSTAVPGETGSGQWSEDELILKAAIEYKSVIFMATFLIYLFTLCKKSYLYSRPNQNPGLNAFWRGIWFQSGVEFRSSVFIFISMGCVI